MPADTPNFNMLLQHISHKPVKQLVASMLRQLYAKPICQFVVQQAQRNGLQIAFSNAGTTMFIPDKNVILLESDLLKLAINSSPAAKETLRNTLWHELLHAVIQDYGRQTGLHVYLHELYKSTATVDSIRRAAVCSLKTPKAVNHKVLARLTVTLLSNLQSVDVSAVSHLARVESVACQAAPLGQLQNLSSLVAPLIRVLERAPCIADRTFDPRELARANTGTEEWLLWQRLPSELAGKVLTWLRLVMSLSINEERVSNGLTVGACLNQFEHLLANKTVVNQCLSGRRDFASLVDFNQAMQQAISCANRARGEVVLNGYCYSMANEFWVYLREAQPALPIDLDYDAVSDLLPRLCEREPVASFDPWMLLQLFTIQFINSIFDYIAFDTPLLKSKSMRLVRKFAVMAVMLAFGADLNTVGAMLILSMAAQQLSGFWAAAAKLIGGGSILAAGYANPYGAGLGVASTLFATGVAWRVCGKINEPSEGHEVTVVGKEGEAKPT